MRMSLLRGWQRSMQWGLVLSGLVMTAALARAQAPPDADAEPRRDNYYAAGNAVQIAAPVSGDAVVAGRRIDITGPITGDILAAGWTVTISGQAHDDVRVVAGDVTVDAPIDGDLTAAGGDVTLGPRARVAGRVWLTGGTVRVNGELERELQIAAGTVQIGGVVRRPIRIIAEHLEVLPNAQLLAGLDYRSPEAAHISDTATVTGPVTFTQIQKRDVDNARRGRGVSSVMFIVQVLVAGGVLLLVLPGFTASTVTTLRGQPGLSFALGFVLAIAVPVAVLFLVVSILGLPLGMAMAALFGVALLTGLVTTALLIGEAEMRALAAGMLGGRRERSWFLVAGVVTLGLLRLIPFAGPWVVFVSVVCGLGAVSLWLYRTLRPGASLTTA